MAKRDADTDEESPHSKRRRLTQEQNLAQPKKQVSSLQDLNTLIVVEGSTEAQSLANLRTLHAFLESIIRENEAATAEGKREVLRQYLQSQFQLTDASNENAESDLIRLWHHALQSKNHGLFSSIAGALVSTLKIVSKHLEFLEVGHTICKTILRSDNLALIDYGLKASKTREHLISPCLRLLKEIVEFDGGKVARLLFRARDVTLQQLDFLLTVQRFTKPSDEKKHSSRRWPSIRRLTIDYLLSNLVLQGSGAKTYLVSQQRWARSLLEDLSNDPPRLIVRILSIIQSHVVEDKKLATWVKARFFNEHTLHSLARLYAYSKDDCANEDVLAVRTSVHALLYAACVSSEYGLLTTIPRELESAEKADKCDGPLPEEEGYTSASRTHVKDLNNSFNSILSFLMRLRPHIDTRQIGLILACFKASSNLIDEYFTSVARSNFEPSLTASWIGQSHFLLCFVQQPLREETLVRLLIGPGERSSQKLLNQIMPSVMSRKIMTRCLNQSSHLVTFLSLQILRAALTKFLSVRGRIQNSAEIDLTRRQAFSLELTHLFCSQCPEPKFLVAQVKSCPDQNALQRGCLLSVLALYHKVSAEFALDEEIDIASSLSGLSSSVTLDRHVFQHEGLQCLELDHLVQVAFQSPGTRWWHKPDSKPLTVLAMLLKMYVHAKPVQSLQETRNVMKSILEENSILWSSTSNDSWEALLLSLKIVRGEDGEDDVYSYLDNALLRLTKKVVYYQEILENMISDIADGFDAQKTNIDLLLITLAEQMPYLFDQKSDAAVQAVTRWFKVLINLHSRRGLDHRIGEKLCAGCASLQQRQQYHLMYEDIKYQPINEGIENQMEAASKTMAKSSDTGIGTGSPDLEMPQRFNLPPGPQEEDEQHRGLTKWLREEEEDAINDGLIGELIELLSSKYKEIRIQALQGLRTFMSKLEKSTYRESRQAKILLGELTETAINFIPDQRLPSFVSAIAARLLLILNDPLHLLYEKSNDLLNRGPRWDVERLPAFWINQILLRPPTSHGRYDDEADWLIETFLEGLQSPEDMEFYRRCNVFERLFAVAASPKLPSSCLDRLLDLVNRCTYVDGSSTLITRCGVIAWLSILSKRAQLQPQSRSKLLALSERLYGTCETPKVDEWGGVSIALKLHEP